VAEEKDVNGQEQEATTTGDGTGGESQNAGAVQFTAEQQARIDAIVAERLQRAREKFQSEADDARKKAEAEAERVRLKEQAEWQKLAEQNEARVAELEPLESRVKSYQEAIDTILAAEVEALGKEAEQAVNALPGEPDALAKLEWLRQNRGLFESKEAQAGTPLRPKTGGTKPNVTPAPVQVRW